MIDVALETVAGALPAVPSGEEGVGFVIIHKGAEAWWLLAGRWEADLLYQHTFTSPLHSVPSFEPLPARRSNGCVWELEIHAHERSSLIRHVLDPAESHVDAYLDDVLQPDDGMRSVPATPNRFGVLWDRGPQWDGGQVMREQRLWQPHADVMNALADDGFAVEGGPLGDEERVLLVISARSEEKIRNRLAEDPWEKAGILVTEPARSWTVLLTARTLT